MPEKKSPRSIANSDAAFLKAKSVMPGGVSSPVRAFKAVGGTPLFIKEAEGCRLTDIDGNEYIDYVASYGPMIVGHANERVVAALSKAIGRGTSYGAPTEAEIELASQIISAIPSVEMVRFVNSGTEATMSAIRLARAATRRDLIIKCIGCYHGHADQLLVEAGSGALTHGTPSSPGVPASTTATTISIHYNDLDAARAAFEKYPNQIACFAIEPIAGNMGLVPPREGYLQGLRELCDQHGTLLLFDEVMTGFRVAWGGAQSIYNVKPDITCLGKVIGGGLPVGAYAARRELMELVSPSGAMYQAGTLSGNPLAMAAGIATLEILWEEGAYAKLEEASAMLADGLVEAAEKAKVPLALNRVGAMLCPFFVKEKAQQVTNYAEATACDTERFAKFFHAMLERGVYLPPSQYEAWFVGLAHDEGAIKQTLKAAAASFKLVLNCAIAVTLCLTTCMSAVAATPATQSFDSYVLDYTTPTDPALQSKLESIDAELRTKLGMTTEQSAAGLLDLKNLKLAMIHPDRIEYAASVPKIGILLAYFQLHPEAAEKLDPAIERELGHMAKQSSNEMAAKYSRQIGLKQIQEILDGYGFYDKDRGGGIWVGKHYGKDSERIGDPVADHSHGATVRQLLRYFLLLKQGKLVSPAASKKMRDIFASPDLPHDQIKFVKALADRDVQIIRKWGTWQNWRHDAAIITGPDRHYILVALTQHPRGDAYLEDLARAVDDHLKSP